MKLGIKVAPRQESLANLDATRAPFCEVWYNATKPDDYRELFAGIKKRRVEAGLHFWGALTDGTLANLAYPDDALIKETQRLMRNTIDTAAHHGFPYVNIHPGHACKIHMDFATQTIHIIGQPTEITAAIHRFLEHAQTLHQYATEHGVILTIETAPPKDPADWSGNPEARSQTLETYGLPVWAVVAAADQGLWVAHDFCHTAANAITDNPDAIWQLLHDTAMELASQTRLIHLGFIVPPYNGTDVHDSLDNPLLDTDQAVPNKKQMIKLLKLFANRNDVWVLCEPKSDHVKNYFLAKKLLSKIIDRRL